MWRKQIVLVSGAPGVGKSTLAARLAPELDLPLIAKDIIKERMWDALDPPAGDLEWSRRIGGAAMEVLWALAAQSPRAVLEANFRPHNSLEQERIRALGAHVVEVHCWCSPEEATRRYEARAARAHHHPAHVTPTLDPQLLAEFDRPVGVGALVAVDTSDAVDLVRVARDVRQALATPLH